MGSPIGWFILAKFGFRALRGGVEGVRTLTSAKEPYVSQRREAKEQFKAWLREYRATEYIRIDLPPRKHYRLYCSLVPILFGVEIVFALALVIGVLPADCFWIASVPLGLCLYVFYKIGKNRARRGVLVKVWKGTKEPVEL